MRRASLCAVVLVAGLTGCTDPPDDGPARVGTLPAEVTGLGPAVFLIEVDDDRRADRRGLVAVERFGDDVAGVEPVRRHTELSFGDPLAPTVARGLAEDPRDAMLSGGRVRDIELPDRTYPQEAVRVRDDLVVTRGQCLVLPADGEIRQPSAMARCEAGAPGGVRWTDEKDGRWGGVNLSTGEPTPGISVPGRPFAATPDGRYLFSENESAKTLIVADTATGAVRNTSVPRPRSSEAQAATPQGYAFVRVVDRVRRLSVLRPDGTVHDLAAPVGRVAFTPDASRAVAAVTRDGELQLSVIDLADGAIRPAAGDAGPENPAVVMAADRHALLVEPFTVNGREAGPVRLWTLDLDAARLAAVPQEITADFSSVFDTSVLFQPNGEVATLSADGRAVIGPAGSKPALPLPGGRVLYRLGNGHRSDTLLVAGADGRRTEIATGADDKQRITDLIPTPDGAHLLVSLTRSRVHPDAGPQSHLVLVRLDGAGEPVLLYRGVALASLGLTEGA